MFSGHVRLLLRLLLVFFLLWLVAKIRIVVLVIAWVVIFACMWILWVKRYSKNKKLEKKLDDWFLRFTKSGLHRWILKASKRFSRGEKVGKHK